MNSFTCFFQESETIFFNLKDIEAHNFRIEDLPFGSLNTLKMNSFTCFFQESETIFFNLKDIEAHNFRIEDLPFGSLLLSPFDWSLWKNRH